VTPHDALAAIWRDLDLADEALAAVTLTGSDPALPSSFRVGTAAQVAIAAVAAAAAEMHRRRMGTPQTVAVDMRHAAIEFRSERYCRVNGAPPADPWDKIAGAYRCRDGWVRLHTNFPHHRDGVLALLDCDYDKAAVGRALEAWRAEAFETAATDAGMVVAALRSFAEWTCIHRPRHCAAFRSLRLSASVRRRRGR
jgi:crotonobetainyl-CoA:carnitine CoA-transferase CaiB-like acyl-CoA transferase